MFRLFFLQLKTVLPCVTSSSGYMHPDPPMREVYRSIFTLACCFWPFGIIAMLKALKVSKTHSVCITLNKPIHVNGEFSTPTGPFLAFR